MKFLAILLLFFLTSCKDDYTMEAKNVCERFVRLRITNAANTKFATVHDIGIPHMVKKTGMYTYEVNSFMDTKDALGVPVRIYFKCVVKQNETDPARWQLVKLIGRGL